MDLSGAAGSGLHVLHSPAMKHASDELNTPDHVAANVSDKFISRNTRLYNIYLLCAVWSTVGGKFDEFRAVFACQG